MSNENKKINNIPPRKKRTSENDKPARQHTEPNVTNKEDIIAAIKKLPVRRVRIGDSHRSGYFDEKNNCVYLIDDNGELTGTKANIKSPQKLPEEAAPDYTQIRKEESLSVTKSRQGKKKDGGKDPVKAFSNKQSNKKVGMLAVIAALFLGIIFLSTKSLPKSENVFFAADSGNKIDVIILNCDVIPGDEITEDMLSSATIDEKTYNQITMGGTDIYKWDRKDNLIGMYAISYIQKNQYMSVEAVSDKYSIHPNPWGSSDAEMDYIDIPVNDDISPETLHIGDKVNLKFTLERKEGQTSEDMQTNKNGVSITKNSDITTFEEYSIKDIVVANIITADGSDIYSKLAPLVSIPGAELTHYAQTKFKQDEEYINSLSPAKLRIVLEPDYTDKIAEAIVKNGVEIEITDNKDIDSEDKRAFYDMQENIFNVLYANENSDEEGDEANED